MNENIMFELTRDYYSFKKEMEIAFNQSQLKLQNMQNMINEFKDKLEKLKPKPDKPKEK